jgi:hypothetical protein
LIESVGPSWAAAGRTAAKLAARTVMAAKIRDPVISSSWYRAVVGMQIIRNTIANDYHSEFPGQGFFAEFGCRGRFFA